MPPSFSVSPGHIWDRASISVIDLVDMGQSQEMRVSTSCPALIG
jgi:hypothetical protein